MQFGRLVVLSRSYKWSLLFKITRDSFRVACITNAIPISFQANLVAVSFLLFIARTTLNHYPVLFNQSVDVNTKLIAFRRSNTNYGNLNECIAYAIVFRQERESRKRNIHRNLYLFDVYENFGRKTNEPGCRFSIILLVGSKYTILTVCVEIHFDGTKKRRYKETKGNSSGARRRYRDKRSNIGRNVLVMKSHHFYVHCD